jgi:hypothetical protein
MPSTLWFRAGQGSDEQSHTLNSWAQVLQQMIQPNMPDRAPMSPMTPASPTFINPFSPRPRDASEVYARPGSGKSNPRGPTYQQHKNSVQSQASRDRPVTYSESPSLRSRRSDLSSQASSMKNPLQMSMGFPNYPAIHAADLPSPATTVAEYQGEFIEGWTSAQGRSSTLSSPIRGRDSIGSQIPVPAMPSLDSSSPPGTRETILDRAFQMRYIPGSEVETPGEEKLSSLARFDALMREADDRRKVREAEEAKSRKAGSATKSPLAPSAAMKSAWDPDDDSDSNYEGNTRDKDDDDDSDDLGLEGDMDDGFGMPSTAQKSLDFLSSQHSPTYIQQSPPRVQGSRYQGVRPPPRYNQEALMSLSNSGSPPMRPQTGYSQQARLGFAQRTHSQPQLAANAMIAAVLDSSPRPRLDVAPTSAPLINKRYEDGTGSVTPTSSTPMLGPSPTSNPFSHNATTNTSYPTASLHRSVTSVAEKRHSTSSLKRLSFTEFTKRLSSTSSLLLSQTNTGGSVSRAGSDADSQTTQVQFPLQIQQSSQSKPGGTSSQRGSVVLVLPPGANERDRENWEKRCGWRGSVGVFGAEGGFL